MILRLFVFACFVSIFGLPVFATPPAPSDALGGHVVARVGDRDLLFPVLRTEIEGELQGDLATVTVRQVFENPSDDPVNARYLFPLNKDAAVHAMEMRVGDEIVRAKIAKRETARQAFEAAKREGKSAALLEQHRPNMFTQEIANLMPGLPVTVVITYSQSIARRDGAYEMRVPLVVGPRYVPAPNSDVIAASAADRDAKKTGLEVNAAEAASGQWTFGPMPEYPDVSGLTIPQIVDADRVAISFTLESAIPISSVASTTHKIIVAGDAQSKTIVLDGGETIDNRDFVLRFQTATPTPQAGVLVHQGLEQNTFSMLIEPPQAPRDDTIVPREMVFVLDTSGSMGGAPMEVSKTFMRRVLKTLRPTDSFRVVRFSSDASEFGAKALPATPRNIAAGIRFVDGLTASGGTEILHGLRRAYSAKPSKDVLRIVVFLSDGYVGNEAQILNLVARSVGTGRLYAFGIGASVNRYLIAEMARLGRGLSRIIDPTQGEEAVIAFADHLRTPVLTDITLDWGGLSVADVTPDPIPDLFAGDSIRIMGRFSGTGTVTVRGKANGRAVSLPLIVDPAEAESSVGQPIPLIWARSRIGDFMREMSVPVELRRSGLGNDTLENMITALGLRHSLVTQWTSFIAVSERVVNEEPGAAIDADVPLPKVKGVSDLAYPNAQRAQFTSPNASGGAAAVAFSGRATPEPAQIGGLLVLMGLLGAMLWRRSRRRTHAV